MIRRAWVSAALLALGGCGIFSSNGDGGGDSAVSLRKDQLRVEFWLLNQFIQGGMNNAESLKCDAGGITTITVIARNTATGGEKMTALPCPAGINTGDGIANLPDESGGPFVVGAVADGKPMSSSEKIRNVMNTDSITVRVYAGGCTLDACNW